MLQAKDLRLNNLLIHDGVIGRVTWIQEDSISITYFERLSNLSNGIITHPKNAHPIPLTEEWLVRFSFEKISQSQFRYKDRLLVVRDGRFFDYGSGVELSYVHTLQNFIYALTGEELTLKP